MFFVQVPESRINKGRYLVHKKLCCAKVMFLDVTRDQCTLEYLKANQKVIATFLQVVRQSKREQGLCVCNQNAVEINGFFSNFLTN